jgi:hypothetical protein
MKARVKATGEIIELSDLEYDVYGNDYLRTELETTDEPDYWDKLYHQAAIAAMQGMLSNNDYIERFTAHTIDGISCKDDLARCAKDYATALVNKLKEDKIMKYTHSKIENLYLYLYPFGIEFNSKPSLFMRFILWMVGFKKYKEEEK